MVDLGFTGTQKGCTAPQLETLHGILEDYRDLGMQILHHGDCIGADRQAHDFWKSLRQNVAIHPPLDHTKRAYCPLGSGDTLYGPKEYLERNRDIIDACSVLIACPKGKTEEQRSGTWATIRYARQQQRQIIIIFPDGSCKAENPE